MRRVPSHLPAVLTLGVVCQIGQVVLLRELLMVFHGNELSLGIILAAWMVWVGIGSRIAGVIGERANEAAMLQLICGGVLLLLPLTVFFIRILRSFFPAPPGAYLSIIDMLIAAFAVTAPIGILLGMQFVFLARTWRLRDESVDTTAAGKTYIAEAAGHALGGVLFTLLLVHLLNSFQAALGAALLMAATTLAALRLRPDHRGLRLRAQGSRTAGWERRLLWAVVIAAVLAAPFLEQMDQWAYQLQWDAFSPEHELISVHQSRHGAVTVARREDQYSFFQSGNLVFSAGGRNTAGASFEEQEAVTAAHFAMVQHPDPKRVLLIGGGLRGTLREILRHPVDRVDYVELDPVLTETALTYLGAETAAALDRGEVRLVHGDGRSFVKGSEQTYDIVIADVPEPATAALNRYYTEEFFREAAARLNTKGVLAIGAASTADLRSPPVANRNATIYHTLRRVFPHVLPAGSRQLYYFAATAPDLISASPATLQMRYFERGIEAPGFSPGQYQILLEEHPLRRVNWTLRRHGRSEDAHLSSPDTGPMFPKSIAEQEQREPELPPVHERFFINSDFRPIGYVHTLAFWNQLTRGAHTPIFDHIIRVEPWWIAPIAALCFLVAAGLRLLMGPAGKAASTRFAVLFAVFTTGLSTMTLQVALLFSFQNVYGFVYEMVGLIVAGFMAGLAVGAGWTHRFIRDKSDIRVLRAVQLVIAVCAALIALGLPRSAALESPQLVLALFFALTFAAGVLNGVDFPIATACALAFHRQAEKATGVVYGVELFGACTGALVAGVVVAPVLGIVACCLLAAIGNATAFLILLVPGRAYA